MGMRSDSVNVDGYVLKGLGPALHSFSPSTREGTRWLVVWGLVGKGYSLGEVEK